jgi:hypothetical protein
MATINLGAIKFNWKGAYNSGTTYAVDDVVSSGGNSYVCIQAHSTTQAVGNATAYWNIMSSAGTNGTDGTNVATTLTAQGDLLYRDGSGLQRLPTGTSGQALLSGGSGANLSWGSAGKNIVANTDQVQRNVTTAVNLFDPTTLISKGANSYYVVHANIILGTNETGSMDDYNFRFNIQYSKDGGSNWSTGSGNVYSTDVPAFGRDTSHGRTYDSFVRTANGRFQITGTSAGTTLKFRVESSYGNINSSRDLFYNRSHSSVNHRQFSSIIVYEE